MTELLMTQVAEAPIRLAVVAYLAARAICAVVGGILEWWSHTLELGER